MAINYEEIKVTNETWFDLSTDYKKLFNSGGTIMSGKEKNTKLTEYIRPMSKNPIFDFSSEYVNTLFKSMKYDKFYKENFQKLLDNYNSNPTKENFILFKREFHKKKNESKNKLIPELKNNKITINVIL